MSQMAGFDFSVVTPMRRRGYDPEAAAAEDRLQLELARNATWDSGPVPEQNLDIAPENVPVPQLGPDLLVAAADQAMAEQLDANGEPPLPVAEEEDVLPPVTPEAALVDGFDFSNVTPITEPRPAEPAGPTVTTDAGDGAATGFDFSQVTPLAADPEAKALNLSFGGQEAALAKAVMGTKKETAPPVTTPEAADGTDVTFKEGDAPFKYTGRLVMVEGTGPTAGLDGMMPVTPAGPVAAAAMAGAREPVMNRQPRLVPDGGQIVFDQSTPERFTEGVERAFESGLLPRANYEKIKANEAAIFKVVDDRRKLEAKAQADPRLLAVLQGVGRGGAMTAGAVAGAKGGAALGLLAGPVAKVASPVLAVAGGIAGGISAGVGYDALYKQLGKHFEEYDNVMQAAELYPQYKQGGELSMAAVSLGVGGVQGARGLMMTASGPGGVPAAARQAAAAGAAGAGTGVVAYPIDAAVRGEEITPGGFATAAGVGVLGGGFFINNRMARTPEIAAVFAKAQRGQKLTAAEEQLFKSAYGPIEATVRRGQVDGQRMVDIRAETPVTTVAGFMPAAGQTQVRALFTSPSRLGAPAMARAEAFRAQPTPRPAEPAGPTGEMALPPAAPPRPTTAPVNVLDPGTTPIPMPGPAVPAMMGVRQYLYAEVPRRGIDTSNTAAVVELMNEHKAAVNAAIEAEQPVSIDALDAYQFDVPYYVRNEETGLAEFDAETFKAWSDYINGRDAEMREDNEDAGTELLDAIRDLGGLPSPKSGQKKAVWSGELKMLWENTRPGNRVGIKGAMNLFRNDAIDLDDMVQGLKARGFRVDTEADLIELLDNRLRSGRPVYGYGLQEEEAVPMEMRGRRAAPGAARQMDLLGESDVEFTLAGQTDRTSLTPEEMIQRNLEAQRAQDAERLQTDMFGEPEATRTAGPAVPTEPKTVQEASLRPEWLRDNRDKWIAMYAMERPYETDYRVTQTPDGQYQIETKLGNEWIKPYAASSDIRTLLLRGGMPETLRRADEERVKWASRATGVPGAVGADPLTPPSEVRSGGPARVPPGPIPNPPPLMTPDWVLQPGETSGGRRLIKGIENFKPGQRWGFRSIVDHVNDAVRLEMRRSTTQTSRTHPAHYKPANHMAYTRDTQSQINFHEAGHGLEYLVRARVPDFFNAFGTELIGLTQRPGSMASDPPASSTPAQAQQYRMGEGVAEWTRLLMTDPAVVQNLKVTAALQAVAERFYPGMAKAMRDGARAVHAFQNKPAAERWAMFNAQPATRPDANELVGAIARGGEAAVNALASGAPVSALDRRITRAIIKQRRETEQAYGAAVRKAQSVRRERLTPLMGAYNMILSIGAETQLAFSGTGPSKGLRAIGPDGNFKYFTHESWKDLRRKVPAKQLAQFDQAAWAKESLERYELSGLEYPGMREGILPEDLRMIVAAARRDIRGFDQLFKEQSRYHDLLLELKEYGGLISDEERARIKGARPGYWPLPRVMTAGRGGAGRRGADISAGLYRARGSSEAIRQIDEVTEERTRQAFEAYYWNRFGTRLYDNLQKVARDNSLPSEARRLAGNAIVKMKMPMEAVAAVSKEEALGWVMKSVMDAVEQATGLRPDITTDDVNLAWNFRDVWRPVKPSDVNVVSILRDGQREYYQLGDPALFALFSNPQTATKAGKMLGWALGPMTANWKRNITQGPVFAVRNLFRDIFTQTMMNDEAVAWMPGLTHFRGAVNKWTQKYPQVFSEGLLLSRVEPSEQEMLASMKHGAVWQWLSEGFYVSQAKDPVVRTIATVLQPSNWLFPLWKVTDLVNLIGPGAVTGFAVGGPVGAAVGAVAGPALGFTGSGMAQFFETSGREGAALSVLRRGGTDEEALMKYWTAAGQFNEHAGMADARIMMNVPGFLNPMLQGLRNQVQKLTDPDPAVAGTMWTRLLAMMPLLFGGAAIVRYLMMDDREKQQERQRPVEDRMNFMDIGGFAMPFPFGVEGVMGSVVYNATMDDLLARPKVDAEKTAWMLLRRIADPGSALQFFGPQLATLTEANMNWSNFRQRHIVSPWMVNLPATEQYYSTTPEFYRKMGQMLNYSPAKLQYIVAQAISRQTDETIRLVESIDGGRPIMEDADVPFVGRIFVRDPIGFGSQSVRSVDKVEQQLQLLDTRLKAKGWHQLRDANFDAEKVGSKQLAQLQMQLQYLEGLRSGMRVLDDMAGVTKYYALGRDFANERNMRRMQTEYAQMLLLGNKDRIATLEQALELLKQIPQAPPEQVAAEYLDRRF
jgi:hypothetical protein